MDKVQRDESRSRIKVNLDNREKERNEAVDCDHNINTTNFDSQKINSEVTEEGYKTEEDKSIITRLHASGIIADKRTNLCFDCGNLIDEKDHPCK